MSSNARSLNGLLDRDEHVVRRSGLHAIFLIGGLIWFATLAGMGWGAEYVLWNHFGQYITEAEAERSLIPFEYREGWIGWALSACGAFIFLSQFIRYCTTRIYVTSRRVIYKTGLIHVHVDGTDISDIRGAHVDQGWLGRFLNYGKINFDCRFVKDVYLPYARDPYGIIRSMQHIKSELEHPHESQDHAERLVAQTIVQIHPGTPSSQTISARSGDTVLVRTIEDGRPLIADDRIQNDHTDILADNFGKTS